MGRKEMIADWEDLFGDFEICYINFAFDGNTQNFIRLVKFTLHNFYLESTIIQKSNLKPIFLYFN